MRLNLGAGGQRAPGWTTLDRAGDVAVRHDLTVLPLPFDDNSCEGMVAHHVLDLLPLAATVALLADCRRILEPGAPLRISLADLDRGIERALAGNHDWFPEREQSISATLGWFITQGGARRTHLTADHVEELCFEAGFTNGKSSAFPAWITELDSRERESFFVQVVKCV